MQALARPPGLLLSPAGRARRPLRMVLTCNAKGAKRVKQSLNLVEAPDVTPSSPSSPPPPADERVNAAPSPSPPPPPSALRAAWRRVLREAASLPRAIAIMAAIAVAAGIGTVLPQNKPPSFYAENYPTDGGAPLFGLLSYDLVLVTGLDHVYSAPWFYALLAALAVSLAACTYTTQLPAARVARDWRFASGAADLKRLGGADRPPVALPDAALTDLGAALASKGYEVFVHRRGGGGWGGDGGGGDAVAADKGADSSNGGALYAFKGLSGRLGPIGVHASMLVALAGVAWSGAASLSGTVMLPEGGADAPLAERLTRRGGGTASVPPGARDALLHVNAFRIDTRPDGAVAQYYSDLSVLDGRSGAELARKTIRVNDPFRYGGVTMYQTDWSLSAIELRLLSSSGGGGGSGSSSADMAAAAAATELLRSLPGSTPGSSGSGGGGGAAAPAAAFRLPLASLGGRAGMADDAKIWATFLPLEAPPADGRPPRGISIVARDPDSAVFYDSKGAFVGVRRAGSGKPIAVEGVSLVLDAIVAATGLELKSDPGVPAVYAGFGGLMLTTLASYASHSQVWALQEGRDVYVAGRSNRAKVLFELELDAVVDAVPELPVEAEAGRRVAG